MIVVPFCAFLCLLVPCTQNHILVPSWTPLFLPPPIVGITICRPLKYWKEEEEIPSPPLQYQGRVIFIRDIECTTVHSKPLLTFLHILGTDWFIYLLTSNFHLLTPNPFLIILHFAFVYCQPPPISTTILPDCETVHRVCYGGFFHLLDPIQYLNQYKTSTSARQM